MTHEELLASFIHDSTFNDLDQDTIDTVKLQILAFCGALIAGSATAVVATADFIAEMGGKPEASIFVRGGKVPAHQAAFANGAMGRALDIDDHISPGAHIGGAVIPAAFSAAELVGGCSGKDLISAIATGTEVSLRLMLEEEDYAGFDPTGVSAVFSSAAASSKLLKLDKKRTRNALGLVFDRCGASFQHFIDGVLAGPIMEGWVAEAGLECARLAKIDMTGSAQFLTGIYGFFALFGRGKTDIAYVTDDLGKKWNLNRLNFKKYPSCGMTQGITELIMDMKKEHNIDADLVEHVEIRIPPYCYKLVGHEFKIGDNPRVDAQFSAAYCLANALFRAPVTLAHFEAEQVKCPEIFSFVKDKITVISDVEVDRTHYSSDIRVTMKDGQEYFGQIDIPPGTPAKPMTNDEHRQRFYDCVKTSGVSWLNGREEQIINFIDNLDKKDDVCELFSLFQK